MTRDSQPSTADAEALAGPGSQPLAEPGGSPDAPPDSRRRLPVRAMLSLAVALLWATHVVASWGGGYQLVSQGVAEQELQDGTVRSYVLSEERPGAPSGLATWWQRTEVHTTSDQDRLDRGDVTVIYAPSGARPRIVVPEYGLPEVGSYSQLTAEDASWFEQELEEQVGEPASTLWTGRVGQVALVSGLLLAGGALIHLVTGTRPRHGTRWFWFWVLGLPGGLGVLAYALWEIGGWRDHRAPTPDTVTNRGGYGVVVLLVGGGLLIMTTQVIFLLMGISVVPL